MHLLFVKNIKTDGQINGQIKGDKIAEQFKKAH